MTPNEFKAWFDGFTEAFSGIPNKTQWLRIKARVSEIDGKSVTEKVYVDRYLPTYLRFVPSYPVTTFTSVGVAGAAVSGTLQNAAFNSSAAMADLGRAEAKLIAA